MPSQPEQRQCRSIDYDGDHRCSLNAGHDGMHKTKNRAGKVVAEWAKLYDSLYGMTNNA